MYNDIIFFRFKDANFDIINHQDSEGRTALHLAVAQHNEAAVRALMAVGKCQISVQDNMKRSPLHWAAVLGLLPSHNLGILRPWYFNQGKSGNAQVCFPCWSPCDVCVTSFYAGNFIATVLIGCFILISGHSKCELLYTFP